MNKNYRTLSLAMCALLFSAAFAQTPPRGRWFTRGPLPTARQEMPLALLDGKIYVPGGFARNGNGVALVEVFEPAANRWSTIADLPAALNHLTIVAVDGRLLVVGGYTGSSFTSQGRVYEYDFQGHLWNRKEVMPTVRGALVAMAYNHKIYAIGGANGANALRVNEAYDPATDTWESLAPMPTAREHLAAAVIDSLIYVVGGRNQNAFGQLTNSSKLEAYSPASNRWYTLPDMPTARGGLAAAAMDGKLYAFGGEYFGATGSGVFAQNEEYDPTTGVWREMLALPTPRHGMQAVAAGDTIFVIGGGPIAGYSVTAVNEGFTFAPLTNVEEKPQEIIGFELRQNYPNPFNAATRITFTLPRAAEVQLSVADVHGREVTMLIRQRLPAGRHEVDFRGERLASGVYQCRLRAGGIVRNQKMVLLR
ncbi:MAG: Kelch repeat-containing protein [bacterium]